MIISFKKAKLIKVFTLTALISVCAMLFAACSDAEPKAGSGVASAASAAGIEVKVEGMSMSDTINNGDVITVFEQSEPPKTGDIIAFRHMGFNTSVKRVIAVAGQSLLLDYKNKNIIVDGEIIREPYLKGGPLDGIDGSTEAAVTIPENKIYVMGDNRAASLDSRSSEFGLVDFSDVIGVYRE